MVLEKKRKANKRISFKKVSKLFIGMIILLYFLSRVSPFFSQATNKTYIAEYGKIESLVSREGLVVRDEKVVGTLGEGEINLAVNIGEKVAKGQKLATIYLDEVDEKTTKDLEIISLRIENIKGQQTQQSIFHRDIEKINQEIAGISKEIQQNIEEGQYEKIKGLKEKIALLVEKKSIISGEKSFAGQNLEQLERQRQILQNKVNASVEKIYSEFSGIVAVGSDGLEDILSLKNIDEITGQQLRVIENTYESGRNNLQKQNIKIIKSHRWSIIVELQDSEIEGMEKGKTIKIRQRGNPREYNALIRNIISEEESNMVILDLNEFMESFYEERTLDLDMIKSSYEGIMIPETAIIEKEGQEGVYRLDINGFSRFVPVKVKGRNREYAIVYHGYFEHEGNRVNTINFYDEIIMYAEKISEGDKVR
ncbi:putative membrane fusion protein [Natronincola ferrireducens]|uniref:Putative membrane fusion protein n=1 Tax=Natronincola ferrireducens TaxID=393762 RepID=A0A1G9BRA4_9FIRM|nr:putative membrane fusion protein [Natronincola ferrireducens]